MNKPPGGAIKLPGHDRPLDFSKVCACEAIMDLRASGDVSVKDVADELTLEHSSASRLTKECEAAGLVERSRSLIDSRRVSLTLTEQGESIATTAKRVQFVMLDALTADWTATDIASFARLLERFSESVAAVHHQITTGHCDPISALREAGTPARK